MGLIRARASSRCPSAATRRSRPSLSQSSWGASRRSSSSARRGSFARARERRRVDHIKSRLKASTLPKKDTACSRSYSQQRLLGRWTCASRVSTPAFAAEVLSIQFAADARRCGRRRPRPVAARGAVFESMRLREGQAGALELKAALRSAVELAKLPAPAYAIEMFPTLGRTNSAARMWPKAHLAAAEIKS